MSKYASHYQKIKELILDLTDKIRIAFKRYFVATETDPDLVRKKHVRIGMVLGSGVLLLLLGTILVGNFIDKESSEAGYSQSRSRPKHTKKLDINKLASGTTNEQIWLETANDTLGQMKQQQEAALAEQDSLKKYINSETVTKEQLAEILKQHETDINQKHAEALEAQNQAQAKLTQSNQTTTDNQTSPIEVSEVPPKAKIKHIGEYIPAGSYAEAAMISGVDAGVGVGAAEDPRQVLLRITGKVISAGYGKDYLTTSVLMGCLVQCQAVGDLSSEKVYLKPVVMTCAKSAGTVVELPVKGYVTASGKSGIRGEVVSREGDLVAKSFFSGLVGGLGSGASQLYQPSYAMSGGVALKQGEQVKNVLGGGLGSGINQSSSRLSDYLIKRAEQYQPIISINEGTIVNLVFQEGFSLNEEEIKNVNVNAKS